MTYLLDPNVGFGFSAEHQRIAEIIKDYDPDLELAWIPPDQRELNEQFPFAIRYFKPGMEQPSIVMRLRADEVDHRVLARLWANDSKNGDPLARIEAEEAARRAVEYKRKMDEAEERKEFVGWAFRAPAGSKHDGMRLV